MKNQEEEIHRRAELGQNEHINYLWNNTEVGTC
jgi:hypothetical protein